MLKKQPIATENAPAAVGPYSQGMKAGDFVYTAGQLGLVPGTKDFAGEDIESQTRQALKNLKAVIEAGSSCLEHVIKTTVFLVDMGEFARMNVVYAEFFTKTPPARSAVEVTALPLGGRVEIEAIAQRCDCDDGEGGCDCDCG